MLSLEDIAAIRFATVICNDPELKRRILHVFDGVTISAGDKYDIKQQWDEIVETQAMVTLRNRGLPTILQEKVMGFVPVIGMRMLQWAVYHEKILRLSREHSIDFLNSSFFTQQGIIDSKKAAEELMEDESLSVEQKYKIACLYCFTDHIPALFKQMMEMYKGDFCGFRSLGQPELLKFWSYYQIGEVDKIKGEKTVHRYLLETAIESGSKPGVAYCLEKTNLRMEKDAIVDAALETVRYRINARNDWVVFPDSEYDGRQVTWVPSDYYADIVYFLYSKMTKDQKIEFLKKGVAGVRYERNYLQHKRPIVLEYFLYWPYQVYFMKTAGLMWEFLPEENYGDLLLEICEKIDPGERNNLRLGEGKSYDYRELLKEFWFQSPERYKRYVLRNQRALTSSTDNIGVTLLIKLLSVKKFTFEDGQIIGIILANAEDNEKQNILSSWYWSHFCIGLIKKEKWEILDRFVLSHFSSIRVNEFKRELVLSGYFTSVVSHFVKNDKWDAAESALKWSSLSAEEVNKFKKEIIHSHDGELFCLNSILHNGDVEVANKFMKGCITSEEELREYKERLIFSKIGMERCKSLVLQDKLELVDKMTNCWLFSQEKIKEFKGKFKSLKGRNICEQLTSGYSQRKRSDGNRIMYEGCKWEEVEKFLTWCFSSEEKIVDFKKYLLRNSGKVILLHLIQSAEWAEAETFFAWLGLSTDQIKKLKKDTVVDGRFITFFYNLLEGKDDDPIFVHYGSKKEAIELILRWCLTDKETVLEFQDRVKNSTQFSHRYGRWFIQEVLSNFDLIIKQHLKDVHEEQTGVKRISETIFSPNKKLCNLKVENVD